MESQVYIEQVFIDNFLITLILLLTSFHLLKSYYSKGLLVIASIFSATATICLSLYDIASLHLFVLKICLGYTIIFIASIKNTYQLQLKLFVSFLFSTAFFAGTYFALAYALKEIINVNFVPIGLFAVFIYIIAKLSLKTLKKYSEPLLCDNAFKCILLFNNKKLYFNAFLDTGNMLIDETCGLPIVLINFNVIGQVLNKKQKAQVLLNAKEQTLCNNLHYVNYNCLSGKSSLLAFKPDALYIYYNGKKRKVACVVGLSATNLFSVNNYQAIFGQKVISF